MRYLGASAGALPGELGAFWQPGLPSALASGVVSTLLNTCTALVVQALHGDNATTGAGLDTLSLLVVLVFFAPAIAAISSYMNVSTSLHAAVFRQQVVLTTAALSVQGKDAAPRVLRVLADRIEARVTGQTRHHAWLADLATALHGILGGQPDVVQNILDSCGPLVEVAGLEPQAGRDMQLGIYLGGMYGTAGLLTTLSMAATLPLMACPTIFIALLCHNATQQHTRSVRAAIANLRATAAGHGT